MRTIVSTLLAIALSAAFAHAQQPVETKHENGQVHERYTLDDAGKKYGLYEEFRADGTLARRCLFAGDVLNGRAEEFAADGKTVSSAGEYRQGVRQGSWVFVSADSRRRKKAEYKAGVVQGSVSIEIDDKVVSRQRWKDGELEKLDDIAPFPIALTALREKLTRILAPPATPVDVSQDKLAAERAAALRRLQAYRALCNLPYEAMTLVPAWNELCDATARVCRLNGQISHTPPRPPGVDDELYRQACEGALHSNLSLGSSMAGSVDGYMDDSDASNIDRIGHRRWCLNPAMGKTGFGCDERFSAMWSMDQSGKGARGLAAVLYPPPGWCPANMFGAEHAFSIAPLRGGEMKIENVRVSVRPLDQDWVPGAELTLDHLAVAGGGYGSGPCLVFRPKGLIVAPDKRYSVHVSTDGGKTLAYDYVVAFCARVPPPSKEPGSGK